MGRAESGAAAAGARAEALAADFLLEHGLDIVARNYRTRRGEIDLIARDRDALVFVEVRQRRSRDFGGAAASITAAKRMRLVAAAQSYIASLPREPNCRFDAVVIDGPSSARIEWLRDIFGVD